MGTYTENLNLYNTDMDTDGNDYFDFDRDLNGNNNKIDAAVGKLSDLSTTNKNNLVAAINEVESGHVPDSRLHALKSYSDEGEVLTDSEGFTDVVKYAHSTFDSSKFTVVGTPTVTNDGIASNFSYTNYIQTSITGGTSSDIFISLPKFHYVTSSALQIILGCSTVLKAMFFIDASGILNFWFGDGSSWITTINNGAVLTPNTDYEGYIKITASKITVYLNGAEYTSKDVTSFSYDVSNLNQIGVRTWNSGTPGEFKGTLDLKYYKVIVDGVPVFSGNKTGIDTYTFDTFKTVGSLSIVDNVASSLSTSNYLTIDKEFIDKLVNCNNFKLIMRFKTGSSLGSGGLALGYGNNISGGTFSLWVESTGVAPIVFLNNNGSASLQSIGSVTKTINTDTDYEIYFSKNDTKYGFGIRALSESTFTQSAGVTNTKTIYSNTQTVGRNAILDSINLKYFQIYAEDDLILQSYLEIPYTWSETNSKVVDVYYKDRLGYLYLQNKYVPYYTLSENKTANYVVVGTPTIDSNFVASGFTSSSVVRTNLINFGNTFELYAKIAVPASFSATNIWMSTFSKQGVNLALSNERKLRLNLGDGTDWVSGSIGGTTVLNLSTSYFIKLTYDGTEYALYLSLDGVTWTKEISYASATQFLPNGYRINLGGGRDGTGEFTGSIDLKEIKLFNNGVLDYEAVLPPYFVLPQGEVYGMLSRISDGSNCMPSRRYTELTLGVDETTYVAPANGWAQLTLSTGANASNTSLVGLATVYPDKDGICMKNVIPAGVETSLDAFIPINKGDTFKVLYSNTKTFGTGTSDRFLFIYNNGSEMEAQ